MRDGKTLTSNSVSGLTVRPAVQDDAPVILGLIRELAEYERLLHEVSADEKEIRRTLFGPRPYAEVLIAESAAEPAAFTLFFHNYSTFLARPGLYLEDLYVRPSFRGRGIGRALLTYLARLAVERGCGRLEWSVLDWNQPALSFYRSLAAETLTDWTTHRLTGRELEQAASSFPMQWEGPFVDLFKGRHE